MNTNYQLSIVIVAYNSNAVLLPCLESIVEHNPLGMDLEVIVVDNHPVNHLQELLERHEWNFILQYLENPKNGGFGQGNNVGAAVARAPYLFFLNPDTVMVEDVITPTLRVLSTEAHGLVGYSLRDLEGNPNNSFSYLPEYLFWFPFFRLLERVSGTWCIHHIGALNRITWPWGAAFSLSRKDFEDAGGFDEHIFLCNEEPDLVQRMPGHRLTLLPSRIIHLEGHGCEVPVARYRAYLESLYYYLGKHRPGRHRLFWGLLGAKLRLKRWVRRNHKDNMDQAFEEFRESLKHRHK